MSTFDGQGSLPKLPIPPLEDTCKRYLLALTPLLTKQELVTTTAAVERFLATDGPALQQSLCEYAADKSSYIEDFWFDAYLSGSSSVVLNINPYFVLEDDPTPSNNDQVHRAASLTMSALQFIGNLRTGTLAADNWRGTPLCMNQYRKLFGCTRVPHQEADEIVCYPESRHLVVMAKGRVYHFDAFWGDGTLCVSEGRLRENLELILDDARTATEACAVPGGILSTRARAPAVLTMTIPTVTVLTMAAGISLQLQLEQSVGVLTSEKRPVWHELRAQLCRDQANATLTMATPMMAILTMATPTMAILTMTGQRRGTAAHRLGSLRAMPRRRRPSHACGRGAHNAAWHVCDERRWRAGGLGDQPVVRQDADHRVRQRLGRSELRAHLGRRAHGAPFLSPT